MSLDTFTISALQLELSEKLTNSRIDKIYMPTRDEIHISFRKQRLLLSCGNHPRAHLTLSKKENPPVPPMFCMLLRKHLIGGRFLSVVQPYLERILFFTWECTDEMGVVAPRTLVCEMLGKGSNIILVDENKRIIDCLRRVDGEMSRPVLPGLFYNLPPKQNKLDPFDTTTYDKLKSFEQSDLLDTFLGLSPSFCRMTNGKKKNFIRLIEKAENKEFSPVVVKDGKPFLSALTPLFGEFDVYEDFSSMLDEFYTKADEQNEISNRSRSLAKYAKNQHSRILRKISMQKNELLDATQRDHFRQDADLVMANLHRISAGAETAVVEDFYNENKLKTIKLNPALSPQKNAAKFYKQYAKLKNAETILREQIAFAERDLQYWESVIEQIGRVQNSSDLREIQEEIHPPKQVKKTKTLSQPMKFLSSDNIMFVAGRNNRQNDHLCKICDRNSVWLHTQKIPGCHVVIDSSNPPKQTLLEAAQVAAFYSGAKTSPKVAVDYTQLKFVKKPPASKPGYVIYDKFKTLLVSPTDGNKL